MLPTRAAGVGTRRECQRVVTSGCPRDFGRGTACTIESVSKTRPGIFDNKGRFRIDGIVGQKYLLGGFGYDVANEVVQAPRTPIEITPGEGTLERDLVLSQSGYSPGCGAPTSPR